MVLLLLLLLLVLLLPFVFFLCTGRVPWSEPSFWIYGTPAMYDVRKSNRMSILCVACLLPRLFVTENRYVRTDKM